MAGRRFLGAVPRLTRRAWEDVASQLEDFLRRMWESEGGGIPAGFLGTLPTTVEPGDVGSAGAGKSTGWAAADHEHPVGTGNPAGLANAPTEGLSTLVPRLDHQHKRDVRVKLNGGDIGTRNALNFVDTATATWSITDDLGNDEVDLSVGGGGTVGESEILTYYGL